MHITLRNKKQFTGSPCENTTYLDNRLGFWGTVTEVNSQNNTVRVLSDTGEEYIGIRVLSREWVKVGETYVTGERNLPPVDSLVFVLMPTGTITGAFVLCSGFSWGESDTKVFFAENEQQKDEKDTVRETVTPGGWKKTLDYSNGNTLFVSADETIVITINTEENNQKSEKQEVSLTAWDTTLKITREGLFITPKKIKLETDGTLEISSKKDISIKSDSHIKINAQKLTVNDTSLEVT